MKNALIVTDMQKGFMNKDTMHIIPRIKSLINNNIFDYVVFTQFINPDKGPYEKFLKWGRLKKSPEIDIVNELDRFSKKIFRKKGYTPFTKKFEYFLEKNKINSLYFVGVDTNVCVTKGAVDAFEKGYVPYVLSFYCASHSGKEFHNFALKNLEKLIGKKQIIHTKISKLR